MKKLLLSVIALTLVSEISNAQCNELFISEYVEGTGNNKALEIYNPTPNAISLSNYYVKRYSNGASTATGGYVTTLTGTIQAHSTFVLVNGQTVDQTNSPKCDPALQSLADQLDGVYPAPTYMNGNDAITLEKGSTSSSSVILDVFGKIGEDPGTAWTDTPPTFTTGTWVTNDHTLIRKASVEAGTGDNSTTLTAFDVLASYDSLPKNTWGFLRAHTCNCPTSINDLTSNTNKINMFPNPSSQGQMISVISDGLIQNVEVYNTMGALVSSEQVVFQNVASISAADLASGIYVVKITHKNHNISTRKLNIQ